MITKIFFAIVLITALVSCGTYKSNGSEYLGKRNGANARCNCLLTISKYGESFLIKDETSCKSCGYYTGVFVRTAEGDLKGNSGIEMLLHYDKILNQILFRYGHRTMNLQKIKE